MKRGRSAPSATHGSATECGTPVYARQHRGGLTLAQQNAVDLLAAGKTDTEAAQLLNLSRTAVTKWRLYSPSFQAALTRRRREVWGAAADRLRCLLPQALDALAAELAEPGPNRFKAACRVLDLAGLSGAAPSGSEDPEVIVRKVTEQRRREAPDKFDYLVESLDGKDLPPLDQHLAQVWDELEARANEPEPGAAGAAEPGQDAATAGEANGANSACGRR
jgi:hypothetical protein